MVGTPGHLRIPEAYEMAEELEEYIGTLDGKVFSCLLYTSDAADE